MTPAAMTPATMTPATMTPATMTPMERAQALRQALQDSFRIDLYSIVAERDFERLLAEAIAAAEHDAFHRGRDLGPG